MVVAGCRGRPRVVTAADRVTSQSSDVSLRARAFEAETGRQLVDVEVFRISNTGSINLKNSHASPTPIVDGDRVYVHYGANGTAALTTSGDIVWKTGLPYNSEHGNGGSPILYRDLLILSGDGFDQAFVVALDKQTGNVRWKTSRRRPWSQAYSTPLLIRVGDRDQVVSVGAFRAAAYDPSTGTEIWRVSYADGFSNVPRPVYGHGLVFVSTGFNEPSLLAVRADGKGDVAMISAPLVEEADALNKKAPGSLKIEGLVETPIGLFATRIIVNAKNPVKTLNETQIKNIFAGKIASWKDVGGPDLPIVVVAEGPGSGGRTLMESRLLNGAAMTDKAQTVQGVGQIAEIVGQNAAAIGYGNPATITSAVHAIPGSEVYQPLILVTKGAPNADAKKLIDTAKNFVTKSSSLQTLALR